MSYYQAIKKLAKEHGLSVTDLLALAPQNDPFYAGTKTDMAQARWFKGIWDAAGYSSGVHLRRAHYWCVSRPGLELHNGEPYENTDKCWKYTCQASKMARYLRLVRIEDIVDNKNPPPAVLTEYGGLELSYEIAIPDLSRPRVTLYGMGVPDIQPFHLEVWVEKSTMNDVLAPVCRRYGANLLTFEGEASITACSDLIRRVEEAGKPARIFYISDFDPAGRSMPVATSRKAEFLRLLYEVEEHFKVQPIALTLEQVRRYRLPRTPIKESERRAGRFENTFGSGAVELDALEALHPDTLAELVAEALEPFYSHAAAEEMRQAHRALRAEVESRVADITAKYQDAIKALEAMQAELRAIEVDPAPLTPRRYSPEAAEPQGWLFDSERGYGPQIAAYKAFKDGLEEAA